MYVERTLPLRLQEAELHFKMNVIQRSIALFATCILERTGIESDGRAIVIPRLVWESLLQRLV
jgi:hypothetical protein